MSDLPVLESLYALRHERKIAEDREQLPTSFIDFVREGWHVLKPHETFINNWHLDAVACHLEAVSRGDIHRLQIWIPPGAMKPVDADALVLMGDGQRKRLRDVQVGDTVITHRARPRMVHAVHDQGLLPVLRITTDLGRQICLAADHPVLTPKGWKNAGDIVPGDVLATTASPALYSLNGHHSNEEMRLLGYFIGDGNCTVTPTSIQANITCVDPVQGADIAACATAMGFKAAYAGGKARRYNISGGVRNWLRETGLAGHTSHTKRVPAAVFAAPKEHVAEFLGAYFACDGTLAQRSETRRDVTVVFNSVHRELLADVQHLLLRLGVRSRIRPHVAHHNNFMGGRHESWRLTITSRDEAAKFIDRVPVIGEKAERLARQGSERTRFDESLQPDPVVSIEPAGEKECRCLTVVEDHSFTANDLVVANTMLTSVFWHPWEWTTRPWLRYWTASYEINLAGRFSLDAQRVIRSEWYQERWGDRYHLLTDAAQHYKNDQGGDRLSTTPGSTVGTGVHGHRILLDDPVPAKAGEIGGTHVDLKTLIQRANEWWDGTVSSRGLDNADEGFYHARVLVMQRLHENDPAAHMLDQEEWTVLCLPERFWAHPYAWRGEHIHPAVVPHLPPELQWGDPRSEDELLWPARRDEQASNAMERRLGYRASGQLQQWPTAREGAILKRDWWRFYDPRHRGVADELPRFSQVVISVDTPLKDKETSDHVAIQVWGVVGGDRYLLDLDLAKMNYGKAKRRITEMARWARQTWPRAYHVCLIENAGYGVELVTDLKREIGNVQKVSPGAEGDKITRAEAASDALESGNCFLPGYGKPWQPAYDEARTPAEVAAFVHSAATFPHALHDDDVDAWSQAMNWLRARASVPMTTSQGWKARIRPGVRG